MPSPESRPLLGPRLIRLSVLLTVLLFGGVVWFLHRSRGTPSTAVDMEMMRYIGLALWAAILISLAFTWGVFKRTRDEARRRALMIIGWAAGEAAALFGGVHYFLTADSRWYVAGLVLLIGSFILFPIRRE